MHSDSMGEAPIFAGDQLQKKCQNECGLKSKGCKSSSTVILDKTYVIGGGDDGDNVSLELFDNASGDWVTPLVLGCKPKSCKGHFAIPLNDDRILIIKKGAEPDDCIWFLEVDTRYVREQRKVLGMAVAAWSKGVTGNADKPIVISGPSGVGKGTLISMLMKEFPSMFGFSVSHTTRAPRNMEQDGVHYHFTERAIMEKEIKDGKFLEFASVHGNLYGTSIEAVEAVADSGKRCILDIDVQGAKSIRASPLEAVFIFICPPSMEDLEKRLRARGTESEEQIVKRLRNAQDEIEQGKSSAIFDHILYNDKLDECYENFKKILGLNGTVVARQNTTSLGINLPQDFSVSVVDNKIIINSVTDGLEKSANSVIVLDVSSLKGGAPGRTRGLDVRFTGSVFKETGGPFRSMKRWIFNFFGRK